MVTAIVAHQEVNGRMEQIRDSIDAYILENYEALLRAYQEGTRWDGYWSRLARRLCRENARRYSRTPYKYEIGGLNAFVADEVLTTQSYFGELTDGLERRFIMEHHELPDRSPNWPDFYDRNRGETPDRVLV